jgi:hypothetical protein
MHSCAGPRGQYCSRMTKVTVNGSRYHRRATAALESTVQIVGARTLAGDVEMRNRRRLVGKTRTPLTCCYWRAHLKLP